MALGEAHVIALTKASLADAGVDVASLEAAAQVYTQTTVTAQASLLQPAAFEVLDSKVKQQQLNLDLIACLRLILVSSPKLMSLHGLASQPRVSSQAETQHCCISHAQGISEQALASVLPHLAHRLVCLGAQAGGHAAKALRSGVERSPTVLLVKNLAYSVTKADLLVRL